MAEELRIHMDGVGGRHGETLRSVNNKFWYPFEPDIIKENQISEKGQSFTQPGGHVYHTNAKSGTKGNFIQPSLTTYYNGDKKTEHIDHKYSIFAGETTHTTVPNMNRYGKPSENTTLSKQIVSPFGAYSYGYINGEIGAHSWACYSNTKGCPLPVYGVSFDFCVSKKFRFVNGSGQDVEKTTSSSQYAYDIQINQMHGLWWQETGQDYISRKLLPNGDNWGGKANKTDQKYIFRNSQSWGNANGETLLKDESQWKGKLKDDGSEKPWTIKAFIEGNAAPPPNAFFMGITFQMAFGFDGSQSKTHCYYISNLGIITKEARDIMRNNPSYHGQSPKTTGLPHIVLPALKSKDSVVGNRQNFYGPMQNW